MNITGAEWIVRLLEERGITTVAGVPGGAVLPLYDALARSAIRHVLARHEQGAAFIAQGMARSTGRAAVCIASSGPGATNLVTALAHPDAEVLCFTGDGSLLMNVQELATLAELHANVKIVLFDNAALGLVHQQQQLLYGGAVTASRYARPSDFIAIARAFGIPAAEVDETNEWQTLLGAHGPALLRVTIDASAHVMPMVAPGAANVEALE